MNKIYRTVFFLKSFSTGLMLPVMSLMLLARGADISNLPLVIGAYSLTVIVLEFPSGVFCDLTGRKKTFLISCILMVLSLLIMLFGGKNIAALSIALIIQGAGRAFSSGSLDALVIERSMELGGDAAVARTNSELVILECAGIAVGSIAGGLLGGIGNIYNANLMAMTGIYTVVTLLVLVGVKESQKTSLRTDKGGSFLRQMTKSLHFSWKCIPVRLLMLLTYITGMLQFSVETFWQPGLLRLLSQDKAWLFGLVSFLGFGLTALSSQICAKLLEHFSKKNHNAWRHAFFLTKFLFGAAAISFGFWLHPALFVCNYCLIYFIHGCESITENTLLAKHTGNEIRAGVMSLFSLVFQFGGLTGSAISGTLLADKDLSVIWMVFGILTAGCTLAAAGFRYAQNAAGKHVSSNPDSV